VNQPNEQAIADRAYAIYLGRGGAHGSAVDDWLQAERELLDSSQSQRRA
jgi:hypothetical protein